MALPNLHGLNVSMNSGDATREANRQRLREVKLSSFDAHTYVRVVL